MTKRILVIDDEDVIRKSFELALEDSGYGLETASSGMEGIERLNSRGFDLVFLDLKMPGMNGVETLREIRKRNKDVPVYIVTAFYGDFFDELGQMADAGIEFEVLNKPVDGDMILKLCQGVLEGVVVIDA